MKKRFFDSLYLMPNLSDDYCHYGQLSLLCVKQMCLVK